MANVIFISLRHWSGSVMETLDYSAKRRYIKARQREILSAALSLSLAEERDPILPPLAAHRPIVPIDSGHHLELTLERPPNDPVETKKIRLIDTKVKKLLTLARGQPLIDPLGLDSSQINNLADEFWRGDLPPPKGRALRAEWEEDFAIAFCSKLKPEPKIR